MAFNPHLSIAAANAAADATCALLHGGALRIYSGLQPATADTAVTTQVLLATVTFAAPAFGAASGGVATAQPMTQDASAAATGTATWCRAVRATGETVFDGSVGTSQADLVLNSVAITAGTSVAVSAFTYTQATA